MVKDEDGSLYDIDRYIKIRAGITSLKIYHNTVIQTCFEMLKSSEHKKLCLFKLKIPQTFKIVLKLIPQFHFTIKF